MDVQQQPGGSESGFLDLPNEITHRIIGHIPLSERNNLECTSRTFQNIAKSATLTDNIDLLNISFNGDRGPMAEIRYGKLITHLKMATFCGPHIGYNGAVENFANLFGGKLKKIRRVQIGGKYSEKYTTADTKRQLYFNKELMTQLVALCPYVRTAQFYHVVLTKGALNALSDWKLTSLCLHSIKVWHSDDQNLDFFKTQCLGVDRLGVSQIDENIFKHTWMKPSFVHATCEDYFVRVEELGVMRLFESTYNSVLSLKIPVCFEDWHALFPPRVKHLVLETGSLPPQFYPALAKIEDLCSLSITWNWDQFSDPTMTGDFEPLMRVLAETPVAHLALVNVCNTISNFGAIGGLSNLQSLRIAGAPLLKASDVVGFSKTTLHLWELSLSECPKIDGQGVGAIIEKVPLLNLHIANCGDLSGVAQTFDGKKAVAPMVSPEWAERGTKLVYLAIICCGPFSIPDAYVEHLAKKYESVIKTGSKLIAGDQSVVDSGFVMDVSPPVCCKRQFLMLPVDY